MELSDWLDQEVGRATKMAAHFRVTQGAVSQWRDNPPSNRMLEIRDFTGGAVTLEEMLERRRRAVGSADVAAS